jgi:tRNA(fMet)-specific endonuclease VapC
MIRYLLDTNSLSDVVRNPQGAVAGHILRVGEASICTSIIVAAELRFCAQKKGSRRLTSRVADILATLDIKPFEAPADVTYAAIRADLERAGRPIDANDLLIAAHAVTLDLTLVTDNERDFRRIRGLVVENWLRRIAAR